MVRYINVPFNSAGFSTGVARMPRSLGFAGVDVPVNALPVRGRHGMLAEKALVGMVRDAGAAVREALDDGEIPVLIGGDCPIMLAALSVLDSPGLVFVDGHEDAWQPTPDVRGEASDSELGIAIGTVDAPVGPYADAARVLALGPRDAAEITQSGQLRVDDLVTMRDDVWVGEASDGELVAVAEAATASDWWLHIDLDVLSSGALGAVDYPQPGGLSWNRLEHTVEVLVALGGCVGASIGVYNPDLDSGLAAPRIVTFVERVARMLENARHRAHAL